MMFGKFEAPSYVGRVRKMNRRSISGFSDSLPEEEIVAKRIIDIVRKRFELAGGTPISTPAFERLETLLAKSGNQNSHEVYGVYRLGQPPEREKTPYGLAFDLTIPLARYVAQHDDKLIFPFRRYQIQRVRRGERPQAGRYREFTQADFDIVGRGTLDALADAEVPAIVNGIFDEIGIQSFTIRINNLKLLLGFMRAKAIDPSVTRRIIQIVDRIGKIGQREAKNLLVAEAGLSDESADELIAFFSRSVTINDIFKTLNDYRLNQTMSDGIDELAHVIEHMLLFGVPKERIAIDLSIARGMNYYTGTVYEMFLPNTTTGSVCSGGRYDNLASSFSRGRYPGVGASIGITRLIPILFESGIVRIGAVTPATVLVTLLDRNFLMKCVTFTNLLRREDIPTELYLGNNNKLGDQLRYAIRKGFRYAIICGEGEPQGSTVQVRDLVLGERSLVDANELVSRLSHMRRRPI
jgi:histidyl-tRNA synthetase